MTYHVLDLHGCSQMRAQVALRHALGRFKRGVLSSPSSEPSSESDGARVAAAPAAVPAATGATPAMATAMAAGGKKKGDKEENDKDDDEQDEGRSMRLEHDLVVITGKGLHSEDAPVLASEARGYLRTAFAPPLEIREVRGNAGRFVVPRAAIEAWVLAAPRGG